MAAASAEEALKMVALFIMPLVNRFICKYTDPIPERVGWMDEHLYTPSSPPSPRRT